MKHLFIGSMVAALVSVAGTSFAQGIPLDSFEYADQAAFDAAWPDLTAGVTLETSAPVYSGSKYAALPVTAACKTKAIDLTPSDSNPVTMDFWIRLHSTALGRQYMHLNDTTNLDVVQYGVNNGITTTQWLGRVNGGSPTNNAMQNVGGTRVAHQWVNLKVEVSAKDAKFFENGVQTGIISRTTTNFPKREFVRLGSNLSSAALAADIDDVKVYSAPAGVDEWNMY